MEDAPVTKPRQGDSGDCCNWRGPGEAEKARRLIHAFKPDVLFYSEAPGPLYMRGFDTVYNYDMQWIYSSLLMPKSDKGYLYIAAWPDERIDAEHLGPWLEQQRLARPRGAFTVQHPDSGDSCGWSTWPLPGPS